MTPCPILHSLAVAFSVGGAPAAVEAGWPLMAAAADCSDAAAKAAAQTGGRVLTVSARNQNGRTVCVVTVLVPSREGGRPRKQTVTVPQ